MFVHPPKNRLYLENILIIDPSDQVNDLSFFITIMEGKGFTEKKVDVYTATQDLRAIVGRRSHVCLIVLAPLSYQSETSAICPRTFTDFNDFFLAESFERGPRSDYLPEGKIASQNARMLIEGVFSDIESECEVTVVEALIVDFFDKASYDPFIINKQLLESFLSNETLYRSEVESSLFEKYQSGYVPVVMLSYL